ncbi:MAG TPA: AgmX/PglI C-terminal domain-containing protein, partial [Myxococcota bacterium]
LDTQVFERDIIKIGRLASAHLRLDDPKVSRIHAVIEVADNKEAAIIDMGSAEGTRVNGEKVSRVRLKHGDEIGLGDSRLVVVLDEVELAALKGDGAVAAGGVVHDVDPVNVTDVTRAALDLAAPVTNAGVFKTGETDVAALRAELQASTSSIPQNTDVFNSQGIDVGLGSLGPQAAISEPPRPASMPPVPTPSLPSMPAVNIAPPVPAPSVPPMAAAPVRRPPPAPPVSMPPMPASILPPLPPIPEDAITPENRYIEVTLRWGGTVTDVKRIKAVPKFTIGKNQGDDLFVPVDGGSYNLLTSSQGQGWKVRFKDGMSGNVTRGDHSAPLSGAGAVPDGDAMAVPLTDDTVVTIGMGYHSLQVRAVPKSRIVPIIPFFDALWANAALVTLFAASAMLATVVFYPVGMDSLEDDLLTNPTKFQTLILKPPPKDNAFLKGLKEQKQAAAKDAGKAGDKKADPKKDQGKMASKAPKDKPTDEQVVAGKMAALFGGEGVASIFNGEASGGALEAALGGIDGAKVAAGYGTGGLGIRGGGPGGGGVGTGTLGTGKIGTRGRGSGDGSYGSGEGGIGKKTDRDISMTTGTPVILGSLDPEIIRRIVREHAGQIRYCYESELTRTPGIFGKIIMKWVINGEGKVMQATTAETQMKNANVENCLASRIKGWVFPKPKGGGIVIVNYPFVFKQSG